MATRELIQEKNTGHGQGVSVWKETGTYEGHPAFFYSKIWRCTDPQAAKSWLFWAKHEKLILTVLKGQGAQHTALAYKIQEDPDRVEMVTLDAGPELQRDWLDRIARTTHALPFWDELELLKLARACLLALQDIHRVGVIHGDFKADNICVSCASDASAQQLNYTSIQLIDFAFSLSRDYTLQFVLPTDADRLDYLPDFFRDAVRKAQNSNTPAHIQKVCHPEIDLYSLGVMLQKVAAHVGTTDMPAFSALVQRCMEIGASAPSTWQKWWRRRYEEPTAQLLHFTEQLLESMEPSRAQWSVSKPLPALTGSVAQAVATPVTTPFTTPLATPLTTPMATPLSPATGGNLPGVVEPQTAPTHDAALDTWRRVPPEAPPPPPSAWQRIRWSLVCVALVLCFRSIDQLYVREGLVLSDWGYRLGLAAFALSVPMLLLSAVHLSTRFTRLTPLAQAMGASLMGIAIFYMFALNQAGTSWMEMLLAVCTLSLSVLFVLAG